MKEFVKKIKLVFDIDDDELNKVQNKVQDKISSVEAPESNPSTHEYGAEEYEEEQQFSWGDRVASKLKDIGDTNVEFFKSFIKMPTYEDVLEGIKTKITDTWNSLNNMLGWSQLTDNKTYELWEKGLTGAEAYAYQQANDMIGIGDLIEDGWRMNEQQTQKWFEKFQKEQARYSELYDSGYFEELQNYQWEMKEFQQSIEFEFMRMFMDNKDTIIWFFDLGIQTMEWLMDTLGESLRLITGRERSDYERNSATSDIIKKYTTQTSNTAVSIDNTWNVSGDMSSSRQQLQDYGRLTYEQVIRMLGGTLN